MARRDGVASVREFGPVVSDARRVRVRPSAALDAFEGARVAWSDPDGPSLVGVGATLTLTASGPDRFADLEREATAVFADADASIPDPARPRFLGGVAFHAETPSGAPWDGYPAARFVLPRVQLVTESGDTWLTVSALDGETSAADLDATLDEAVAALTDDAEAPGDAATAPGDAAADARNGTSHPSNPPGVSDLVHVPDRETWRAQVASVVDRIERTDLRKAVIAQTLRATLSGPFDLPATLDRLDERYPECVGFAVDPPDAGTFFGATPERLVALSDREVSTEAIAGSVERGETPDANSRLADRLRDSEKVADEHELVVRAIRDRLSGICESVTTGDRDVYELPNVQHLRTPIEGTLAESTHVLSLVERLHPTPAVGGVPPELARDTIAETESFDRGWYAAPVGWFDADGDGRFAVGIRSAVAADGTVTLFAGNGIVAGSDPDEEWTELQLKYRPILEQLE